ncbi:hypothetical protein LBMAG53_29600 [Planctomycetota bacterium]|nr:hypothetical protein LBMAG53_29600 [Planctomycetota bacterium]
MWAKSLPQDRTYRLTEATGLVLVGTTADNTLRAYKRSDGSEAWRYSFDGALRWSPAVSGDAVVAGSDDGTVACLALADGALRWRYRPSPDQRQSIGHLRLQSSWPIATTVAIADGAAFGMCGLFKEDGIWAFAVDLKSGEERWLRRQSARYSGRCIVEGDGVGFGGLGSNESAAQVGNVLSIATGDPLPGTADAKGKIVSPVAKASVPVTPIPRLRRQTDGTFSTAAPSVTLDVAAAITGGAARDIPVPTTWNLVGPQAENPAFDERAAPLAGGKPFTASGGVLDLMTLFGEVAKHPGFAPPVGIEAYAETTFDLAAAGTVAINASADWFLRLSIDGATVIDTLDSGNGAPAATITANTGLVDLTAGAHRLALRLRPGSASWSARLRLGLVDDPATVAQRFAVSGRATAPSDPLGTGSTVIQASNVDGTLLLLTATHAIHGFGPAGGAPATVAKLAEPARQSTAPPLEPDLASAIANHWVLVAGANDGALAEAIATHGKHAYLVITEGDAKVVAAVRRRLSAAGLMADGRVQVVNVDPTAEHLPPWAFQVVVSERGSMDWKRLTRLVRPYGGRLALPAGTDAKAIIAGGTDLEVSSLSGRPAITRPRAVTGGADWSHELADPSNASGLHEPLVKFPLAVNWYGGPADLRENFLVPTRGILEGTVMQPMGLLVVQGVWLLQGLSRLTAYDQYTGRELWKVPLPAWYPFASVGLHGKDNEKEPWADPIADALPVKPAEMSRPGGFNMSADATTIFVAAAKEILAFDLATGSERLRIVTPKEMGDVRWGTVRALPGALVATLFSPDEQAKSRMGWDGNGGGWVKDRQRMRYLACFDSATGKLRWSVKPERGFINHGVAVGADRVFALDLVFGAVVKGLATSQADPVPGAEKGSIAAYDLASGKALWNKPLPAMLTDIVYSAEHDLVLLPSRFNFTLKDNDWVAAEAGEPAKGKGKDKVGLLVALRGKDGEEAYRRSEMPYQEPYAVVGNRIVQRYGQELSVTEGSLLKIPHPVTSAAGTYTVARGGCTWLIQSDSYSSHRHGYSDLDACLSGDYGGIDHGCVPALQPAGGLVNVSNVGSTRFGNRSKATSRTLVHRSRQTAWNDDAGLTSMTAAPTLVKKLGILPGAPGNRADADQRWWLRMLPTGQLPTQAVRQGSKDQPLPTAESTYEIAEHRLDGAKNLAKGLPEWVGAWGLIAPPDLCVPLVMPAGPLPAGDKPRYRITVVVAEPDRAVAAGKRVFNVSCDGVTIAEAVDPVRLAGAPRTAAHVTAEVTATKNFLVISCTAAPNSLPPVVGGVYLERVE